MATDIFDRDLAEEKQLAKVKKARYKEEGRAKTDFDQAEKEVVKFKAKQAKKRRKSRKKKARIATVKEQLGMVGLKTTENKPTVIALKRKPPKRAPSKSLWHGV